MIQSKPSYIDLVNALQSVLPYAISRAEDLHAAGGNRCQHWKNADVAIERANELLDRLSGNNAACEVAA